MSFLGFLLIKDQGLGGYVCLSSIFDSVSDSWLIVAGLFKFDFEGSGLTVSIESLELVDSDRSLFFKLLINSSARCWPKFFASINFEGSSKLSVDVTFGLGNNWSYSLAASGSEWVGLDFLFSKYSFLNCSLSKSLNPPFLSNCSFLNSVSRFSSLDNLSNHNLSSSLPLIFQ